MVRRYLYAALAVTIGAASVATLQAQEGKSRKFLTKPLVIEDQGSFFIGGVPKVTTTPPCPGRIRLMTPNQITIGQMYVQFQIPANKKRNMPPVIMVHGSTHTAACLESTPDGREGWYPYFVRNGDLHLSRRSGGTRTFGLRRVRASTRPRRWCVTAIRPPARR